MFKHGSDANCFCFFIYYVLYGPFLNWKFLRWQFSEIIMPGGQWEVVGGKSKKTKQKNGVNKNSNQKKKAENRAENATFEAPGL